jgi:hypothetical protein
LYPVLIGFSLIPLFPLSRNKIKARSDNGCSKIKVNRASSVRQCCKNQTWAMSFPLVNVGAGYVLILGLDGIDHKKKKSWKEKRYLVELRRDYIEKEQIYILPALLTRKTSQFLDLKSKDNEPGG